MNKKRCKNTKKNLFRTVMSVLLVAVAAPVLALEVEGEGVFAHEPTLNASTTTAQSNRWALAFDNDFLVPGGRDQDYTYGFSVSYTHSPLGDWATAKPLTTIDHWLGLNEASRHSVEMGLYGFTPEDLSVREPNANDRPYASLVYGATRSERLYRESRTVVRSQLTLGVLGLDWVGDLQNSLHAIIDSKDPEGWDNQVSAGGELTARYSLSRQQLLASSAVFEVKQTQAASLGYLTEASWGLNLRLGAIHTAWHSFNPDLASYAETSALAKNNKAERYFWAGFAIKARAYNAFLQGQFRDTAVAYSADELEHVIVEAWAGYTYGFSNGVFVSYGLRGHSSEVRSGGGDRHVVWGGLMIGHNI